MKLSTGFVRLAAAAALLALAIPTSASAQQRCRGTLGGSYDDLVVSGGTCTLDGALVRGSVQVNRGNLVTRGSTQINGSVLGDGARRITLGGGTLVSGGVLANRVRTIEITDADVLGGVSAIESGNLTIGAASDVSSVKFEKSGRLVVLGAVGGIESTESGRLQLDGATVFPGSVLVSKGSGSIEICSSVVEGELKVSETSGSVEVDCGPSVIDGTVSVEKGTGSIRLTDASLPSGDLLIVEQVGNVTVVGTSLSDVLVEKVDGNVTLTNVTTDSDTTLAGNGNVTLQDSTFGSDAKLLENGRVTLRRNDFALEDISLEKNAGPVLIEDNTNFSIAVIENDRVTFRGNDFTDANISKNSGSTRIDRNAGDVLSCSDNSPAPTGSGNVIRELADGQCRRL